jgi:hypothetical protein
MKSWASWKRSQLKGDWALWATLSRPVPRTQPVTSRPWLIMSMIANSSASQSGSSQIGSTLPRITIFARCVIRARIAASTLTTPPMQKGVEWCSLSMRPSKPICSA